VTDLPADEAADASSTGPEPLRHFLRISDGLERLFEAERNQLPLWLPVGLIVGISAWFWLPGRLEWIAFLTASLALAVGLAVVAGWTRWGRALSIFMFAAVLGCGLIWWKAEHAAAPRLGREQLMVLNARIESVQALAAERTLRLIVTPLERLPREGQAVLPPRTVEAALPARLRVNVEEGDAAGAGRALVPGAIVRIRAWLMPPAPMAAPGAYDFARTAWFQRIGGSGRVLDLAL
jgi:competence protein ComEC